MSLLAATVGLMGAGTVISTVGSIEGGQAQKQAAGYEAQVAQQQAAEQEAAGTADVAQQWRKTQLALSSNTARAAASGVNPGFGSPTTNTGNIAKYGTYNQLMAMYNAQTQAAGAENQAQADIYGGKQAATAGWWNAGSSILGGASAMLSKYG